MRFQSVQRACTRFRIARFWITDYCLMMSSFLFAFLTSLSSFFFFFFFFFFLAQGLGGPRALGLVGGDTCRRRISRAPARVDVDPAPEARSIKQF